MFLEMKEYTSGMFMVKCWISLSVDAEVVHIDLKPTFSDHISKYVVHKCLERGWGIAESKEHNCGFKESERSDKCSLPLIHFLNLDVVIPPTDVKFGEQGGILHVVDEFRNKW